jgi:hypothetical protein
MLQNIIAPKENELTLTKSELELVDRAGLQELNIPRKMTIPGYITKLLELANYITNLTESTQSHDKEHYDVLGPKDIYDRTQKFKKEFNLS